MFHTVKVALYEKTQTGTDDFGSPIWSETPVEIEGCLVAPTSSQDKLDSTNLYGVQTEYQIAIPKGDTHDWANRKVSFFGKDWRTVGDTQEGIESNIPLAWNKKIQVVRDEPESTD